MVFVKGVEMKLPIAFLSDEHPGDVAMEVVLKEKIVRSHATARAAQKSWASTPMTQRLQIVRRFRHQLGESSLSWAEAARGPFATEVGEALCAQVIPLADACRFVERKARRILRRERLGWRGRPLWLQGVEAEITREPYGVILIIGAANYPLFIPGVQVLQALVAGNGVVLKPGRGGAVAALALLDGWRAAGLPTGLLQVLPDTVEAGQAALQERFDKVVFTGGWTAGQEVAKRLVEHLVPSTMELSGCDAVFVREDADLDRVARALSFGLRWNGGATCIAPRRVFVSQGRLEQLEAHLLRHLSDVPERPLHVSQAVRLRPMLEAALSQGATLLAGTMAEDGTTGAPLVLSGAQPSMELLRADIFAPILSLIPVKHDAHALEANRMCPFALGASVFGQDRRGALALAREVNAGVVTVNDLIVPTADPRLPFGGRGWSGFGVTRGAEGLLEMTVPKVTSVRQGRFSPHLEKCTATDLQLFQQYCTFIHGSSWRHRWSAVCGLVLTLWERVRRH